MASVFEQMMADINAKVNACTAEINERLKEEVEKELKVAMVEFGQYQASLIEEVFREAVEEFYDAYTPILYTDRGGLFDVLDISFDADGLVDDDPVSNLYNPDKMNKDRHGGDLFQKVFMQGWHGGAESGAFHPSPGTPYYRKLAPEFCGPNTKPWQRWSRPAVRTESPDSIFKRKLSSVEGGQLFEEFKRLGDAHAEIAMQKMDGIVPSIVSKYF